MEHPRREDRWFTALSRLMDVGILLLGRERNLDYANAVAGTLLGYASVDELAQHWMELQRLLAPALERACERTRAATPLELELASAGVTRRLRFEIYRLEEDECEGFLVL